MMSCTTSDHAVLARERRWRLWMIRIGLAALVTVILLAGITLFMISSSGLAPEEAEAICMRLTDRTPRVEFERLLGKAQSKKPENGSATLTWVFTKQSLNQMDVFTYKTTCNDDGTFSNSTGIRCQFEGWSAWLVRWWMLKQKMGWQ